ncbi:uncharacterized protein LOC135691514 [Rhopilema esculentum]|uniref:uncharacterized protein LOC135691514 n=1 Tax=Rhopilema esculentum TaxID=499914 RepID=UPI0031CEC552|eukprot:gene9147-16814_t
MVSKVELGNLLDFAIGTPETGAVNLKILHSFLHKLISHLAVSNVEVEVKLDREDGSDEPLQIPNSEDIDVSKTKKAFFYSQGKNGFEERIHKLENKMNILDSFGDAEDILKWANGRENSDSKVADLWNFINLQKRIEATENGIRKVGGLVDKILAQLKNVSDLQDRMFKMEKRMNEFEKLQDEVRKLSEKINILDGDKKIDELIEELNNLKKKVAGMPLKKDLELYVQWPHLETALEIGEVEDPITNGHSAGKDSEISSDCITSSKVGQSVAGPSAQVLHKLHELGGLSQAHWMLKEDVERLKQQINGKADKSDLENLSKGDVPEDLIEQLDKLHADLNDMNLWRQDVDTDRANLASMKAEFDEIKKSVEKLQTTMKHVVDEHARKQKHIDTLYATTDKLQDSKADKTDIEIQLSTKVDKVELENFVSRHRFDENIGRIDDALKELIDKFRSNDESLNKMIFKIISDLEGKLDRDEFLDFKEFIENRLKALKSKMREEPVMDEDPAAVFKKAMLQFNCLSCDRPVYFSGSGPIQGYSGLSAGRSGRPYTSYDLEQVRLLQKASLKPDANDYTMPRSCGGSHTSGNPNRRISAKLNTNASDYVEVAVPAPTLRNEVDIQGHDGKLYKGRVDKNEEFPAVNKGAYQNGRIKPKSAHGGRSPNMPPPGEGNFMPRRPKTAVHRSTTPDSAERQMPRRAPSPDIVINSFDEQLVASGDS